MLWHHRLLQWLNLFFFFLLLNLINFISSILISFELFNYSFAQYVDYALDVPMYFVYRKGKYVNCTGMTFRVIISLWYSYYLRLSYIAPSSFILKLLSLITILFKPWFVEGVDPFLGKNWSLQAQNIAGFYGREASMHSWRIANTEWLGKSLDNYISWGLFHNWPLFDAYPIIWQHLWRCSLVNFFGGIFIVLFSG